MKIGVDTADYFLSMVTFLEDNMVLASPRLEALNCQNEPPKVLRSCIQFTQRDTDKL